MEVAAGIVAALLGVFLGRGLNSSINRLPPEPGADKGRLVGDVDYTGAQGVAAAITPVPGGVGPMTIAVLLRNTLVAAYRNAGLDLPEGAL